MLPSEVPRHRLTGEGVSWCLETSLFFKTPFPGWISVPTSLSLFLSFIFFPTSFWRNGLPFCTPDVLCQHSEVVLWKLLSAQMSFQWICGGESGLPVLVLRHLRTTSRFFFFNKFIYLFLAALRWIFVVARWLHCLSACGNFPDPTPGSTSLAGRFLITGQPTRQLLSAVIIKNEMI